MSNKAIMVAIFTFGVLAGGLLREVASVRAADEKPQVACPKCPDNHCTCRCNASK